MTGGAGLKSFGQKMDQVGKLWYPEKKQGHTCELKKNMRQGHAFGFP